MTDNLWYDTNLIYHLILSHSLKLRRKFYSLVILRTPLISPWYGSPIKGPLDDPLNPLIPHCRVVQDFQMDPQPLASRTVVRLIVAEIPELSLELVSSFQIPGNYQKSCRVIYGLIYIKVRRNIFRYFTPQGKNFLSQKRHA